MKHFHNKRVELEQTKNPHAPKVELVRSSILISKSTSFTYNRFGAGWSVRTIWLQNSVVEKLIRIWLWPVIAFIPVRAVLSNIGFMPSFNPMLRVSTLSLYAIRLKYGNILIETKSNRPKTHNISILPLSDGYGYPSTISSSSQISNVWMVQPCFAQPNLKTTPKIRHIKTTPKIWTH